MFLVVDIGNSHTVTGMFDGDQLVGQWRLQSARKSTADELAVQYQALWTMAGVDAAAIDSIMIASVVPTLETAWVGCCEKYFHARLGQNLFLVREEALRDLVRVDLDNPEEVGADRLVNSIAAWDRYRCKLVVIDFGTAITFDCVSDGCTYLGGAILPGIAISLEALASRTARLPHIDVSDPPSRIIGKSTVQAMKSGILFGYGAMVDGLVAGIRREMLAGADEPFRVLATGGMASLLAPFAKTIEVIDPLLTLHGLALIHNRLTGR
jgi:type III pantothenate kinase